MIGLCKLWSCKTIGVDNSMDPLIHRETIGNVKDEPVFAKIIIIIVDAVYIH